MEVRKYPLGMVSNINIYIYINDIDSQYIADIVMVDIYIYILILNIDIYIYV